MQVGSLQFLNEFVLEFTADAHDDVDDMHAQVVQLETLFAK